MPRRCSTASAMPARSFIGRYTPEVIGDYVGGSNHVLPTARSARFSSGLSVLDFVKRTSMLQAAAGAVAALGPAAIALAEAEGLMRTALGLHPAQPLAGRAGSALVEKARSALGVDGARRSGVAATGNMTAPQNATGRLARCRGLDEGIGRGRRRMSSTSAPSPSSTCSRKTVRARRRMTGRSLQAQALPVDSKGRLVFDGVARGRRRRSPRTSCR
jgi:hypothetical protein